MTWCTQGNNALTTFSLSCDRVVSAFLWRVVSSPGVFIAFLGESSFIPSSLTNHPSGRGRPRCILKRLYMFTWSQTGWLPRASSILIYSMVKLIELSWQVIMVILADVYHLVCMVITMVITAFLLKLITHVG